MQTHIYTTCKDTKYILSFFLLKFSLFFLDFFSGLICFIIEWTPEITQGTLMPLFFQTRWCNITTTQQDAIHFKALSVSHRKQEQTLMIFKQSTTLCC